MIAEKKWLTPSNILIIVCAVITIVAMILIPNYFRDNKELSVVLIASEPIIQNSKEYNKVRELEIINDTEPLSLSLIKISVKNTGDIDILESDFQSKFDIRLSGITIYGCYITTGISKEFESNINNELSFTNHKISIDNFVLLQDESFIVNTVTDKIISKFDADNVNTRILGTQIKTNFLPDRTSTLSLSSIIIIVACYIVLLLINIHLWRNLKRNPSLSVKIFIYAVTILSALPMILFFFFR